MYIVIPMAGASSRFYNAGYTKPKYMLPLGNETVFDKSVRSFEKYFNNAFFIFVIRADDIDAYEFVQDHANALKIKMFTIIVLKNITRGQAETVYEALVKMNIDTTSDDILVIFNIDTIRYNLKIPVGNYSSYFDAFYDPNPDESKWSFCKVDDSETWLIETAEKKKISNWCSTGLYIFGSVRSFARTYRELLLQGILAKTKFYIAPMYNYIIPNNSKSSNYLLKCLREDVEFSGVPDEYETLKIKYSTKERD